MASSACLSDQGTERLGVRQIAKGAELCPGADPHGIDIMIVGLAQSSGRELNRPRRALESDLVLIPMVIMS